MLFVKPIIYTIIVLCFIWLAVIKRDSKVLYNVIMAFCWIIIALSMDSYDIGNYRGAYDYGLYRGKEPIFDLLQFVFSNLNIPFSIFKVLYGTAVWMLLYRALKNYTLDIALATAIFVLGPLMGFGTQMRSSMAGAIILNALPLLLKKDSKVWKYCVLVVLASLFHLMAAFYFVFLIPRYLRISDLKFRNIMCILALFLIPFFLIFAAPISRLLTNIQALIGISAVNSVLTRLAQYFSGEMSPNVKGFLFASCGHFVVFFLTDRMCDALLAIRKGPANQNNVQPLSSYAVSYLRKTNSILVLIIPCYILSMQFDRLNSYFIPVCYCLIVQGARELRLTGHTSKIAFTSKAPDQKGPLLTLLNSKCFQPGNFEITILLACLVFCFFVNNRFSATSEFVRIINGIAMFAGPK